MMTPAAPSAPVALRDAPLLAKLVAGALALGVGALSWQLWPEWRHNPDLSHGLFMPVVFLLLLHESRSAGTPRFLPAGPAADGLLGGLLLGALLALGAAGLYAASLGWSHAVVNFTLTAALTLLLGAGLVGFAGQALRLVPFNWNALVALALWLL